MELNDFKGLMKSGNYAGVYIFAGEEDYLKRYYLAMLKEKAMPDDSFSTFNYAVYDGGEVDFSALYDDIAAPPMFEPFKVIEWRYPDFTKMKEADFERLESTVALAESTGYTVLAFLAADGAVDLGMQKKPSSFVKRFGDKIKILNFEKSTDAQLMSWLKKHFDAEEISVTAGVLNALIARSGHSMTVLNNEVIKLCMLARSRGLAEISKAEVEEAASPTLECETFAFSNAILDKNKRAAFLALEDMKSQRQDPIAILGMMSKIYTDIMNVAMMLRDGIDSADIQTVIKFKSAYQLKLYISAAKKYTPESAEGILTELSRVDTGAKFGGVAGYTAIELFIAKYL